MKKLALALCSVLALSACATPGEESRPDVYAQGDVNHPQQSRVVTILSAAYSRTQVENHQNHRTGQIVGGLLGAGLGAGIGAAVGAPGIADGLAGAAGGAGGVFVGGQIAKENTIVASVTIVYQDRSGGQPLTVTQIGKVCEYAVGEQAQLVLTDKGETRVQPNAVCPKKGR